jgi:DhnA family fructose-bisphosphate aldolase class Ia
MSFDAQQFLPDELIAQVTELRVSDPERPLAIARRRRRRSRMTVDGRLSMLAADHPARRVLAVGTEPSRMADRRDYLARILRVLEAGNVDGVMASMDIIEDLLVLDDLRVNRSRDGLLHEKILIPSLNRGGLQGSSWEMDDPMTGATPATIAKWKFDGAKVLLRICDEDRDSMTTIKATAQVINEMNALGLPLFLEPLPAVRHEGRYKILKNADALAGVVSVATALGDSSRYLWLKLPYCDQYDKVARATTLPILLLGGESSGEPEGFIEELRAGLAAGNNVRGVMVGRNVLYPGDEDPGLTAGRVSEIVHAREAVATS